MNLAATWGGASIEDRGNNTVPTDPHAADEAVAEARARRCAMSLWIDRLGYWTAPYAEGDEARGGFVLVATCEDRVHKVLKEILLVVPQRVTTESKKETLDTPPRTD